MENSDEHPADRRHQRRRERDIETEEIVEHAVQDAPIVNRLLKTGRMATAALAMGALIGGGCAELGIRYVGPKDDSAALALRIDANVTHMAKLDVRTDSLVTILTDVLYKLETIEYIQCVQLRRTDTDLRPNGCDETAPPGRRP